MQVVNVDNTHQDVIFLLHELQQTDTGLIVFPFDAVQVDFLLKAA